MASILKVGEIKSKTGNDSISIADSGAITANGVLTATNIQTDSIKDDSGTRVLASDSGSAWNWGSGLPSGSIVQVQYFQKTDTANMSNIDVNTDYVLQDSSSPSTSTSTTGIIQVNITPQITNSKIWLQVQWFGEFTAQNLATNCMWFLYRNTTKLSPPSASNRNVGIAGSAISYSADDDASTPEQTFFQYFDTHGQTQSEVNSGTQITYKLGFRQSVTGSRVIATNRTIADSDTTAYERGVSSICAIELAP